MSNDFYDHLTTPSANSSLSSAVIRAEFDQIEQGFDKLPTLAGNALKKIRVNAAGTGLEAMPDEAFTASDMANVPAGNISATNVQAAINELDSEKAATGHNHTGVYQPASANLDEYAAVNPTAAGLALLDDADVAAQQATLGLRPGVEVQAYDANAPTAVVSQAEAEAGVSTATKYWTPERVKQAVVANAPASPVTSVGGNVGAVSNAQLATSVNAANGGTPALSGHTHSYVATDANLGVGCFALIAKATAHTEGATQAGSGLSYSSADAATQGGSPAGTWRCHGRTTTGGSGSSVTVWQRIA